MRREASFSFWSRSDAEGFVKVMNREGHSTDLQTGGDGFVAVVVRGEFTDEALQDALAGLRGMLMDMANLLDG